MYEAIAVKDPGDGLYYVIGHNLDKKRCTEVLNMMPPETVVATFDHMLHHPGEAPSCRSCKAAWEEDMRRLRASAPARRVNDATDDFAPTPPPTSP